jgi:hypothetical protein
MKLYRNPVLWSENNQLTGEFMQIKREKDQIRHANIQGKALAVVRSGFRAILQPGSRQGHGWLFCSGKISLVHVVKEMRALSIFQRKKRIRLGKNCDPKWNEPVVQQRNEIVSGQWRSTRTNEYRTT